jgi:hypothetical protein
MIKNNNKNILNNCLYKSKNGKVKIPSLRVLNIQRLFVSPICLKYRLISNRKLEPDFRTLVQYERSN